MIKLLGYTLYLLYLILEGQGILQTYFYYPMESWLNATQTSKNEHSKKWSSQSL